MGLATVAGAMECQCWVDSDVDLNLAGWEGTVAGSASNMDLWTVLLIEL